MCGICGFTGIRNDSLLRSMTNILVHRGPDEFGYYVNDGISLGHRRLSIIDLKTGRQPIFNEDNSVCIIFNGEIYNYLEIKRELLAKGHKFITHSDTEVIVHLYEEIGEDCVKKLNGIFSFAIWDDKEKQLLLARDRLGVKPLYYSIFGNQLFFASEIKSILENKFMSRDINLESLDIYLSLRYIPGNKTLLKNIYKLPPASIMIYKNGQIKVISYWKLEIDESETKKADSEYIEEFIELLTNAVKLQLMSDVPFGAFISGGIDSGAIVSLMNRYNRGRIKTFTVGFNTDIDEFERARKISRYFGTVHQEIVLDKQTFRLLPEIVWHMDEPVGDSIVIPIYLLSKEAAKSVKMVLTGEGADEIFGSYIHQIAMHFAELYKRFSNKIVRNILKWFIGTLPVNLLNQFFPYPASLGKIGKMRLLSYLDYLDDNKEAYFTLASVFTKQDKNELYAPNIKNMLDKKKSIPVDFEEILNIKGDYDLLNRVIYLDLKFWLPDYTLCKLDNLTMANSIEARVPFLDHKLVEFCAKIPIHLKLKGFTTKYLLRKSMDSFLPSEIVKAPKRSFYFPVEKCFGSEFNKYINELLSKEIIIKRGLFNYDYIKELLSKDKALELISSKQLMSLVILENWMRIFVD